MHRNNDHKMASRSLVLAILLFIVADFITPLSIAQDAPEIGADEIKAVMQDAPPVSYTHLTLPTTSRV